MNSSPDRPFVASDPLVAVAVERWLDRQGYAICLWSASGRLAPIAAIFCLACRGWKLRLRSPARWR